jgi:cleavage stimulation factor subunit 3
MLSFAYVILKPLFFFMSPCVFSASPQSHYWLKYSDFELKNKAYDKVEAIFSQCLRSVLSVDLWKFYLEYVLKMNTDDHGRCISDTARTTVQQSYEFALQHIGTDKDSGSIWANYIHFIKNIEVGIS